MSSQAVPVLHVITKMELGGAQQNTLYIVENLDRDRFAPHLISGPGGMLNGEAEASEVPFETAPGLVRAIRPWSDWVAYRQLRSAIRRIKPQVVHTHSSKAGVLGRLAAAAEGVPVVMHTVHGFGIGALGGGLARRVLLAAERMAARRTTHFVPVSKENFDTGVRLGLFDERTATVIDEGVDLRPFREPVAPPDLAAELGIKPGAPVVGMIACFKQQKDPLTFVEVAARVRKSEPETRFLMLGDGELRPAIEERIGELGLTGVVKLLGWRRDVPELLALMRVSVLTSLWEGLPRVIAQSLTARIPVVVTRAGGSPEAVREGQTGFVCEVKDVECLAKRIVQILRDPLLARRLGEAGPASVEFLDADLMVRRHEELYEKLLREVRSG